MTEPITIRQLIGNMRMVNQGKPFYGRIVVHDIESNEKKVVDNGDIIDIADVVSAFNIPPMKMEATP